MAEKHRAGGHLSLHKEWDRSIMVFAESCEYPLQKMGAIPPGLLWDVMSLDRYSSVLCNALIFAYFPLFEDSWTSGQPHGHTVGASRLDQAFVPLRLRSLTFLLCRFC